MRNYVLRWPPVIHFFSAERVHQFAQRQPELSRKTRTGGALQQRQPDHGDSDTVRQTPHADGLPTRPHPSLFLVETLRNGTVRLCVEKVFQMRIHPTVTSRKRWRGPTDWQVGREEAP